MIEDLDAADGAAGVVADAHREDVHPAGHPPDAQLREDRRQLPVLPGAADPVLGRVVPGGVEHKLAAPLVVVGGRLDAGHVAAVAQLRHREAPGEVERVHAVEQGVVVAGRSELDDGSSAAGC